MDDNRLLKKITNLMEDHKRDGKTVSGMMKMIMTKMTRNMIDSAPDMDY